jgi:hypothetical protein
MSVAACAEGLEFMVGATAWAQLAVFAADAVVVVGATVVTGDATVGVGAIAQMDRICFSVYLLPRLTGAWPTRSA